MLGVLSGTDYLEETFTLEEGTALVMVTGGVVEGPGLTLDTGLERARTLAAQALHDGLNAEAIADRILDAAVAVDHLDDRHLMLQKVGTEPVDSDFLLPDVPAVQGSLSCAGTTADPACNCARHERGDDEHEDHKSHGSDYHRAIRMDIGIAHDREVGNPKARPHSAARCQQPPGAGTPEEPPNSKEGTKPQTSMLRTRAMPVRSRTPMTIGSQGPTATPAAHNRDAERSSADAPMVVAHSRTGLCFIVAPGAVERDALTKSEHVQYWAGHPPLAPRRPRIGYAYSCASPPGSAPCSHDESPSSAASLAPWSHRTRRGADLALAIPLLLLETAWLVLDWMFGLGMEVWAAQGDKAQVDAATLAHINRVWVLLVAVLIVAVLAGLFRAPGRRSHTCWWLSWLA